MCKAGKDKKASGITPSARQNRQNKIFAWPDLARYQLVTIGKISIEIAVHALTVHPLSLQHVTIDICPALEVYHVYVYIWMSGGLGPPR
jgi:hypothetical protein